MSEPRLDNWREWGFKTRPSLVRLFTAGKNHHTSLIEHQGQHYVLKTFDHSFANAVDAQTCAAESGLAPEVLFADGGVLIMPFIDGDSPTIEATAISLSTLHNVVSCDSNGLDLMPFYDSYLEHAPVELKRQHQTLLPLLDEFINDKTPWCFCHNDLVNENCIDKSGEAIFIDWEFAAKHNPWFDLAAIILYRELNDSQARTFLNTYNNWQHMVDERIYITSQIALLWGDLLWHVDKYGNGYHGQFATRFSLLDHLVSRVQ